MVDNHHIDDLFKSALDTMEQTPSEKARLAIEAALDKKRALLYQRKASRYRLALAFLMLLLISFVAYTWLLPSKRPLSSSAKLSQSAPAANSNAITSPNKTNNIEASTNPPMEKDTRHAVVKNNVSATADNTDSPNSMPNDHTASAHTYLNSTASAASPIAKAQTHNANAPILYPGNYFLTQLPLIAATNIHNPFAPLTETPQYLANHLLPQMQKPSARSLPLSLALHYSPQLSFNYLTDNKPDHIDDVQMYNDRESGMYAFNTGLDIRYHFGEKWAVALGVGYASNTKSIKLPMVYATQGESSGMQYEYPTASGMISMPNPYNTTLHEGDSLALGRAGTRSIKYVNIPATVRYTIPRQKINFFMEGGLTIHLRVSEQVAIDMGSTLLQVKNASAGLNKINYGWMLGAGAEMPFTEKVSVFAEPTLHGAFTSITQNIAVNNYPYAVGLRAGVSIKF